MKNYCCLVLTLACLLVAPDLRADALDDLARDFWTWRASEQPISFDDIPRIERTVNWVPDWSPKTVAEYRTRLGQFEDQWKRIDASSWPVPRQVDYRLMGSAIARVRWELELLQSWQKNPEFYVQQTLGAYFELLLPPPPFDSARTRQIMAVVASIPQMLEDGKANLTQPVGPFAQLALNDLEGVRPSFSASIQGLKPVLDTGASQGLDQAASKAIEAMEAYRAWLAERIPKMSTTTAVGREKYVFFLRNVALLPFTPEQLLQMGRQEWARSVAFQVYEEHRNAGKPQLSMVSDEAAEIAREARDEEAVRRYLEAKDILTVPGWMQHYVYQPTPAYLVPMQLIEGDDFTGPDRLKDKGIRYLIPPGPGLGYFARTMAEDPRGLIVHEGVPGHYFQLALSWSHPDLIRRHYYDSSANEGLGFYAEEMMMNAGLFDDSPRSREFIWNFMRLRALRVEVDVKLALGEFTIQQAEEYLKNSVPMDAKTAHGEASNFASTPGQAISYQTGKLQIFKFLGDARRDKGDAFSLRAFHDFLWLNGNVPIALQRWEFLGSKDEVESLNSLR